MGTLSVRMGSIPVVILSLILSMIGLLGCGEKAGHLDPSIHRPHPEERASISPDVGVPSAARTAFPEERRLREIIAVGARALTWKQSLEKALRSDEEQRSSKRSDGADKGTSPDHPDKYNHKTAIETFEQAWVKLPVEAQRILKASSRLPDQLPAGVLEPQAFLKTLGKLSLARGDALRFMDLYPDREKWYSAEKNDFRIWMRVRDNLTALREDLKIWMELESDLQKADLEAMRQLCRLVDFESAERCARLFAFSTAPRTDLASLFEELVEKGIEYEESILGVTPNHKVIKGKGVPGAEGALALEVRAFDVAPQLLSAFRAVLKAFWERPNRLSFRVSTALENIDGVMFLSVRPDVVAHVTKTNVHRDTIVLEELRSLELDSNKATLAHEFGHVLGFADCYVEFWDEAEQAFLYYDIDPQNLMCNSRGNVLESHIQDLLNKFAPTEAFGR